MFSVNAKSQLSYLFKLSIATVILPNAIFCGAAPEYTLPLKAQQFLAAQFTSEVIQDVSQDLRATISTDKAKITQTVADYKTNAETQINQELGKELAAYKASVDAYLTSEKAKIDKAKENIKAAIAAGQDAAKKAIKQVRDASSATTEEPSMAWKGFVYTIFGLSPDEFSKIGWIQTCLRFFGMPIWILSGLVNLLFKSLVCEFCADQSVAPIPDPDIDSVFTQAETDLQALCLAKAPDPKHTNLTLPAAPNIGLGLDSFLQDKNNMMYSSEVDTLFSKVKQIVVTTRDAINGTNKKTLQDVFNTMTNVQEFRLKFPNIPINQGFFSAQPFEVPADLEKAIDKIITDQITQKGSEINDFDSVLLEARALYLVLTHLHLALPVGYKTESDPRDVGKGDLNQLIYLEKGSKPAKSVIVPAPGLPQ